MGIFFNYVIHFFNDKLLYEASFKAIYLIGAVIIGANILSFDCNFNQGF